MSARRNYHKKYDFTQEGLSLYELDKTRWSKVDGVITKAIGVIMGASLVDFFKTELRPESMSPIAFSIIFAAICVFVCSTIAMFSFDYMKQDLHSVWASQRELITMTCMQIQAWAFKDVVSSLENGTFLDAVGLATGVSLLFLIGKMIQSRLQVHSWKAHFGPPFLARPSMKNGEKQVPACKESLGQYYDFLLSSLPLSVGYSVNHVCLLAKNHITVLIIPNHEHDSLGMMMYAVYFALICSLSTLLTVYTFADCWNAICVKPVGERVLVDSFETEITDAGFALMESNRDESQSAANYEEMDARIAQIEYRFGVQDFAKVSRMTASRMSVKGMSEAQVVPQETLKEQQALAQKYASEIEHMAIKFLFAWSVTYFLNYFFFDFIETCSKPVAQCGHKLNFYFACAVTVVLLSYIPTIATVNDEHNLFIDTLFKLQIKAAPLNVGFAWKGFIDAWIGQIRGNLGQQEEVVALLCMIVGVYCLLSVSYHIYKVIAEDTRMKPLRQL